MNKGGVIGCAEAMIRILEKEGIKFVFGHPGEQILPLYESLRNSKVKHILMRHEQGAAHAADGYARASAQIGVCMASAGPGALNMVMGVATAYKDSVPLLVITGDIPITLKGKNTFQDVDQVKVFQPITLQSMDIKTPEDAIIKLLEAFETLKSSKTGPIHLNLPKDVLCQNIDKKIMSLADEKHPTEKVFDQNIIEILNKSYKPLIVAGSGVLWAGAVDKLRKFAEEYQIPVATTYPARGVLSEEHHLSLGMLGIRGTPAANYAGNNADTIMALGCRLSERTLQGVGDAILIHVNIDKTVLQGDHTVNVDVGQFLDLFPLLKVKDTHNWLKELSRYDNYHKIKTDYSNVPMKPQRAIWEILDAANDSIIVNDAGTHTTWVTLLRTVKEPSSLLFSGGFGPMGYGVPAAVGASLAKPEKNVIVVAGDGGFQMTSQELATIQELQLPILIIIINNHSLGIIKQWQKLFYGGSYQVELENPDFIKLAGAYNIEGIRLSTADQIYNLVEKIIKTRKPYLLELIVDSEEGIPLPDWK